MKPAGHDSAEDFVLRQLLARAEAELQEEEEALALEEAEAEKVYSDREMWPAALRELLSSPPSGGSPAYPLHDPSSATGLLCAVAPMLLHRSAPAPSPTSCHDTHVERPARIVAIYHRLLMDGLVARARLVPARPAATSDLELVHSAAHVARATRSYSAEQKAYAALHLEPGADTFFAPKDSGYAALLSAGSLVELTTRVVSGELSNAVGIVRPPGHHCEAQQAMGFCLLNNVAVAAAVARSRLGVERVLIVDWDVHHGNGIQHLFEADPAVLYVSLHRYGSGFYPGTGAPHDVGFGKGAGFSVNVAFRSSGYSDAEYASAFEHVVMPISREFEPELVLVSSGFDAAARDPLGGMELTPAGYAHMTRELLTLAHGRMVVALEGGYNLLSIAASASAVVAAMLGDPPPTTSHPSRLPPRVRSGARRDISLTMAELAPHWPVIDKALRQRRAEGIRGKPTLPARRDGGRENGRRARSTAWPARGSAAPRDSARLPRWYRELYGVAPAGIAAGRGRQQQRGPRRVRLPWPFSWRMTGLPRRRVVGLAMR